jgi:hypothetical protein
VKFGNPLRRKDRAIGARSDASDLPERAAQSSPKGVIAVVQRTAKTEQ